MAALQINMRRRAGEEKVRMISKNKVHSHLVFKPNWYIMNTTICCGKDVDLMKTAIVFYSWSGHTAQLAKARAEKEGAALYEIKDKSRPGALGAYTAGCFAAMRMKRTPTLPFTAPLGEYDRIIIMAPVWAGHPAPAVNTVFDALPDGKEVAVCMVSGGGKSGCREKVQALVDSKGCKLAGYEDIRA